MANDGNNIFLTGRNLIEHSRSPVWETHERDATPRADIARTDEATLQE